MTATVVHSSAPMRLSIAGGGTDLPESYRHGPTTVVAAALTLRVHVCVADRAGHALEVLDTQCPAPSYRLPPAEAAHHPYPAAAAVTLGLSPSDLPRIAVASPVLPGSGLGGSGAYCVALIDALARWAGRALPPERVAALAFRLEREVLGRTIGQQDAWAAALGGVQRIRLTPDGTASSAPSPTLHTALDRLIDTGLLLYRIPGSRDASRVLAKARTVTATAHREALAAAARTERAFRTGDIAAVGSALRHHWARKTAANPAADHPVCRRLADAAGHDPDAGRSANAGPMDRGDHDGPDRPAIHGFKVIGAGGGGHLLIAADPRGLDRTRAFLAGLGLTPVVLRLSRAGLSGTVHSHPNDRQEETTCGSV